MSTGVFGSLRGPHHNWYLSATPRTLTLTALFRKRSESPIHVATKPPRVAMMEFCISTCSSAVRAAKKPPRCSHHCLAAYQFCGHAGSPLPLLKLIGSTPLTAVLHCWELAGLVPKTAVTGPLGMSGGDSGGGDGGYGSCGGGADGGGGEGGPHAYQDGTAQFRLAVALPVKTTMSPSGTWLPLNLHRRHRRACSQSSSRCKRRCTHRFLPVCPCPCTPQPARPPPEKSACAGARS